MKIESVKIENFRCFANETIHFSDYSCLIGANGSGKSTVITALNVFFRQFKDSKTDLSKLSPEDFHHKNVKEPIRITVTFHQLSQEAEEDLADYVRQGKLIISAEARFDPATDRAEVRQFGSRLGIEEFRKYFEAEKNGASAASLKGMFAEFKSKFPDLNEAKTKPAMAEAIHSFESLNPDRCKPIPSEDHFYGASKGSNRLAPHLQWVFVPAVKDITEESQESKSSGLGQLLARTIRSKVDFSEKIAKLRDGVARDYQSMLDDEQAILDELSNSLETKLRDWAHPDASAKVLWTQDSEKTVRVDEPWAYVEIGERGFEGELARFGHGMQRSFMLTLLQEISGSAEEHAPTLMLAIEEPELYQHPPQARYLAEVLHDLSLGDAQIIICSHSPLFIPGDDFEAVRVVRETGDPSCSCVTQLSYSELSSALHDAGQKLLKEAGMLAKLYPALSPGLNEMFFCKVLILVEGLEDVAYISSVISLAELMPEFRKFGCHIVPVGGKSEMIKPIAMAKQLDIPVFVVLDADTDNENENHIILHKRDNKAILTLMGYPEESDWPDSHIRRSDLTIWQHNIGVVIESEIGENWKTHCDEAVTHYGQASRMAKNPIAVSRALESAWKKGDKSKSLERLATEIIGFAKSSHRM